MKTIEIKGSLRQEVGKKVTKLLRKDAEVPCVLYGGEQNMHFHLNVKEVAPIVYTPNAYLVSLNLDGKIYKAIMHALQFHPVTDDLLHLDFKEVFEDKRVVVSVPIIVKGFAVGVQAGGKLQVKARSLKVKGLVKDMPEELVIDITNLELGKSIKVADLNYENLELMEAKNSVICSVKLTRAAKGAAGEEANAAAKTSAAAKPAAAKAAAPKK